MAITRKVNSSIEITGHAETKMYSRVPQHEVRYATPERCRLPWRSPERHEGPPSSPSQYHEGQMPLVVGSGRWCRALLVKGPWWWRWLPMGDQQRKNGAGLVEKGGGGEACLAPQGGSAVAVAVALEFFSMLELRGQNHGRWLFSVVLWPRFVIQ
jgi:hypothetical protein